LHAEHGSANWVYCASKEHVTTWQLQYAWLQFAWLCIQEQAAALHSMGMMDYFELKGRLLLTTGALVATGSVISFSAGGVAAAGPFAAGGLAGLMYQYLLQQGVDAIPGGLATKVNLTRADLMPLANAQVQKVVGSPAFRLSAVSVMALAAVWAVQTFSLGPVSPTDSADSSLRVYEVRSFLTAAIGFMMYKLAVVGVTAVPAPVAEKSPALEKNV
jgi:hypothetical protein